MYRFRSRVSIILLIVLVAASSSILFLEPGPYVHLPENNWISLLIWALAFLLLFGIRYEITETHVCIKIGPVRFGKTPIDEIQEIERSYIFFSAPAASLKRLYITSKKRDMLISPSNEEEFIRILKSIFRFFC